MIKSNSFKILEFLESTNNSIKEDDLVLKFPITAIKYLEDIEYINCYLDDNKELNYSITKSGVDYIRNASKKIRN